MSILKIVLWDADRHVDTVKFVYRKENVMFCDVYESRSGAHWDVCYWKKGDDWMPYRGWVIVDWKLGEWKPMMHAEVFKSFPPEGKWFMKKKDVEVADFLLSATNWSGDVLMRSDVSGIELYYARPYEKKVLGTLVLRQSNLEIYSLFPRVNIRGTYVKKTRRIVIGNHSLLFDAYVDVILDARYPRDNNLERDESTVIVDMELRSDVTIAHPEHETVKGVLEPGLYFVRHFVSPVRRD